MSLGIDQPPDVTSTTRYSEHFYSNEDVGILHEIVLLAQELWPTLPERERLPTNALFGAYYDVLPRLGLDADHDNRYARVLFKIGGLGGPGGPDGLYQRFESVLSKMGIELELEEHRDETRDYGETQEDIESVVFEGYERPQTRRRRNSESTVWDIEPRLEASTSGQRRNSFSGRNNPPTVSEANPVPAVPPTKLYQSEGNDGSSEEDDTPDRNVRAWLASRPGESRRGRGRSVSTHGSLQIRRRSPQTPLRPCPNVPTTNPSVPSDEYHSPSDITAVTSAQEQTSSSIGPLIVARTEKTADNLMHIKASLFRRQRVSGKCQFRIWRERTARVKEDIYNLKIIGWHYGGIFLLRRTLHTWQKRIMNDNGKFQTEKYYENVERRCLVVRDWNLLRKAFSQWKELTLEEVERASIARRHILRTRTFHAWREYTVVNEFKIRKQITNKFFIIWKTRYHNASNDATLALQAYNANLAKKIYVEWFWSVCNIKTTVWWAVGTKQRALSRWITALLLTQRSLAVAEKHRNLRLLGKFRFWKEKTSNTLLQDQQAIELADAHLCLNIVNKWRRESQVVPARITVETDVNWRLVRQTFATWLHRSRQNTYARNLYCLRITRSRFSKWHYRTAKQLLQTQQEDQAAKVDQSKVLREALLVWRQSKDSRLVQTRQTKEAAAIDRHRVLQEAFTTWRERMIGELFNYQLERKAAAIDRQRILREAWTNWRHKSRLQVMINRVNERVVREAVYKWTLAERICYAKDFFSRRIFQACLEIWTQKAQASRLGGWVHEEKAYDFARRRTKHLAWTRWTSHARALRQREIDALRFYAPRLEQGVVSEWSGRAQHLLSLQKWSRDANFYFLASKSLKRWKISIQNSKRDKVKVAYAHVRRMSKMSLARKSLLRWRQKAKIILRTDAQASELRHNKTVVFGMNIFDRWRARTEEIEEMEPVWEEKILQKQFTAWKHRCSAFKSLEIEAVINYQERQMSHATRKWSLLNLRQLGRSHHAVSIREKSVRKAFRKTFTYWQQRTAQRRPISRPKFREAESLGNTLRAETWSDMGEEHGVDQWPQGLGDRDPLTPVPGYLSTPSRRTERVTAAAARFVSTTPRAQLSSPFERQLRAQYSGGLLPAARGAPGRSRLGISDGFADVVSKGIEYEKETV